MNKIENLTRIEKLVLYYSLLHNGDFQKTFLSIKNKEKMNEELFHNMLDRLGPDVQFTTIFSDLYPEKLREMNCPPFVIYYKGDVSLINQKVVALDGTMKPDEYGRKSTEKIAGELAENDYVILTKPNIGVDTIALETSLNKKGKAIAVSGSGVSSCYPKQSTELYERTAEKGLVISEYPFECKMIQDRQFGRDRLMSGLCDEVIILQATELKKEMNIPILVAYALENGKDVYAVPSPIDSEFQRTNKLIEEGANIYYSIKSLEKEHDFELNK